MSEAIQDESIVHETIEETTMEIIPTEEQPDTTEPVEETEEEKTLRALESVPELLEKLQQDNTQYDVHVQLIETLKLVDLPDQLEDARVNMHNVYPLSEGLWLDWINDAKEDADTEEGREKLLRLYDEAQEDYLSINIWKSYVEYVLENFHAKFDDSITEETEELSEFINSIRTDLQKAVGATKYHIKQSQEIWKPYSEFELEVLSRFKNPEQLERVTGLYLDRLSVLHIDCEDTFNAYSTFVSTYDNANYETKLIETNKIYAKTKRAAEERDIFELKIVSSGYALDTFYEYIENEKVTKQMASINNVRCLYERAIIYYCTDPSLWDDYILYLLEKANVNTFLNHVCLRATRNCPWSGILWSHRARLLESENADEDQMDELFDAALASKQLLSSIEDLVTILLAKIDYKRRKIDWEDPDGDDIINLQVVFEESLEYLKEAKSKDPYYRIEKYYAYISDKRLRDEEKARELWEDIIQDHGKDTEAWIQYITFERDQGNYQKCESLFKQAIQKKVDNPVRLIDVWNTMGHEFCTLESYNQTLIRCNRTVKGLTRQWQAVLAAKEEEEAAKKAEREEAEKRKKGIRRMENKKKLKEKKAENPPVYERPPHDFSKKSTGEYKKLVAHFKKPAGEFKKPADECKKPVDLKKPMEFLKPADVQKSEDTTPNEAETKEEAAVQEDKVNGGETSMNTSNNEETGESSTSCKRKASDGGLNEVDAKKHKVESAPAAVKPFRPQPRATRGLRGGRGRGKSLALGPSRVINKQNTADKPEQSALASEEAPKSNDDFRNMLLGKK